MTFLAIRAFLAGVPKWAWYALAAVVLLIAAGIYINGRERAAVEADRNASKAETVSRAREADELAEAAAVGKNQEVSDANVRAQAAADAGSDPLADGLRSLRTDQDRNGEASGRAD